MIDILELRNLFNDEIIGGIGTENNRNFVRLKEKSENAELKKVDIYDVPDNSLLIKIDATKPPHSLFKTNKGECRRCDYILISEIENKPILLFIEMKSTKKIREPSEIIKQFHGAECIIDYCNAILERFHNKKMFFNDFNKYFVVFYKPRIAKRNTRPAKEKAAHPGRNNTPESMLKYPSPHNPSLNQLIIS